MWRQGQKYGLPCLCFINKMDKIGADFEMAVKSIRDKLLANPVGVQIPDWGRVEFKGLIDLIDHEGGLLRAGRNWGEVSGRGDSGRDEERADAYRHELIEAAAEYDET